ncbi:hypothetical protein HPY42_01195 [Coprothermobacteraceae bacterium]|nr:hypothetical protein [Coprothermobacteraceae bacterium]
MRWISIAAIAALLLTSLTVFVIRWQDSHVIRIYLPVSSSEAVTPWTAITAADRAVVYATRSMLFRYSPSGAEPELAESATSKDYMHWTISLRPVITATQVIKDWSQTLGQGDPTVVGKIFYYLEGAQAYKNKSGPFSGLKATATYTLEVITTFPLNLPMLLADPTFATSATTEWSYSSGILSRPGLKIIFQTTPTKADIIWTDNGNLFSGTFDYAVSSTLLPTAQSTCAGVPVADLSGLQTVTPTVFYVPASKPPQGKVNLYPWQLDYPDEQAFKLGIAVLLDKPSLGTSTLSLGRLSDETLIYVANPRCYSLTVAKRVNGVEVYLDLLDLRNVKKKVF